ncbi:MAG: triphosphoribosyl-dephospho-CoA synthase [Acidiferrobacterales bacterium]|nr:triphosphoribosyl-dephospho-CoA synthase [Acidiferrobacterales bacterium]
MVGSPQREIPHSLVERIEKWNTKATTEFDCSMTRMFWHACVSELTAVKPGNVHCFAAGHGMEVEHFLKSAYAVAGVLGNSQLGTAQKIYQSVQATRQAVAMNTNLGIILLCVPIAQACSAMPTKTLQQSVHDEIEALGIQRSRLIVDAIRLAAPSGLGKSARHDVCEPVNATIREIMAFAQESDMIARQYATGFADVFQFGFDAMAQFDSDQSESVTGLYLCYLSAYPDTHVCRQHGLAVAKEVQNEAGELCRKFQQAGLTGALFDQLLSVDTQWKQRDINPGTSADLTVATLFAHQLVNEVN